MPRTSVMPRPFASSMLNPWYSDDLLPELQNALATLADIETRFEIEREHLQGPESTRAQLAAEIESRYQAEREPCVQHLAELHHRMVSALAHWEICESA